MTKKQKIETSKLLSTTFKNEHDWYCSENGCRQLPRTGMHLVSLSTVYSPADTHRSFGLIYDITSFRLRLKDFNFFFALSLARVLHIFDLDHDHAHPSFQTDMLMKHLIFASSPPVPTLLALLIKIIIIKSNLIVWFMKEGRQSDPACAELLRCARAREQARVSWIFKIITSKYFSCWCFFYISTTIETEVLTGDDMKITYKLSSSVSQERKFNLNSDKWTNNEMAEGRSDWDIQQRAAKKDPIIYLISSINLIILHSRTSSLIFPNHIKSSSLQNELEKIRQNSTGDFF